jgi:UDP-glucose 4-epimerase
MHILLTSSSGWLGRFLGPMLNSLGHEVTGLDVAAGACTDVIGSVADRATVDQLFAAHAFDAVIHAGTQHNPLTTRRFPAQHPCVRCITSHTPKACVTTTA